jgi:DNA-binding winged helix-turn-helix (wHTH) protein/TolB-like protein/Tfp pilus assembly protein PilF
MIYRVSQYEINTTQFTFSDSGKMVPVEPKVFDVIVYLLNHRNTVISRDELFAQIWANREVTDTTLSNHIKSARKLFGDSGELQSVIKTIRGRGYQFVADVEEVAQPQLNEIPVKNQRNIRRLTTLFISIVLFIGFWLWWTNDSSVSNEDKRRLVLVLPFTVSSVEHEKWQAFADQMTREVIRKLNHVPDLRVIPASSAFIFNEDPSYSHIRNKLPNVSYVLNAVINHSGSGYIRISADMVGLPSEKLIWNRDFETNVNESNYFTIQNNIANTVAESLEIVLGEGEKALLSALPTENLAAYELYVKGQQQLNLLNHSSLLRSIELFDQAITLDPTFILALVAKVNAYRIIMAYFEKPADVLPKVITSVNAVLSQDPQSAEALSALGLAYVLAWRWEDAWKILFRAKTANPDLALTELGFALYFAAMGDKKSVNRALQRATMLDPLNVEIADWGHWALAMVGDLELAREWAKKQMRLHPQVGMVFSGASVSSALNGDYIGAIEIAEKGLMLDPESPYAYLALAQAYGYAGEKERIPSLLQKAESLNKYMCPYESAVNYIILDDFERAFSLLNEAVSSRSNCLVFTRVDKRLEPIKGDPRFSALLTRIGLDDNSLAKYLKQ